MKQIQLAVSEIRRGQARPVYLIHGEEAWLVHQARQRVSAALVERGANLTRFSAESDPDAVISEMVSLSLFAEPRVILWADCPILQRGSAEAPRKRLLEALDVDLAAQLVTFVVSAEKADRQSKLVRRMVGLGEEIHCPALSPYNLGQLGRDEAQPYVEAFLSEAGKSIDPDAFRELRTRVSPDLWSVMSELERLVAYLGDERRVGLRDVEELVSASKTDVVFDLVDAVGSRDLKTAFGLLERLVESGTHPLMILATLAGNLGQVREARLVIDSGGGWSRSMTYPNFQQRVLPSIRQNRPDSSLLAQHPYAAFKAFQRGGAFRVEEIDGLIEGLADIDLRLKSTDEDGLRALQMLLVARTRPEETRALAR